MPFSSVEEAIEAIRRLGMVVVVDDEDVPGAVAAIVRYA